MPPSSFEMSLFHAVNQFVGISGLFDSIVNQFAINNLVKNGLFIGLFWLAWFSRVSDQIKRYTDLCFVLSAVVISLFVNRAIATMMPFRPRPMFWTDIGFIKPNLGSTHLSLENFTSFPSDHAALYLALTTGFWFIARPIAVAMAIWSALCLLARIYLGLHFPGDIAGGAAIGIIVTLILRRHFILSGIRWMVEKIEQRAPALFRTALVLFTFQLGVLFLDLRLLARGLFNRLPIP